MKTANSYKPDVLVLNRVWLPIHIIDWGKAMSLVYQEKCKSLDRDCIPYTFDQWKQFTLQNLQHYPFVQTVNYPVAVPEIIVSVSFDRLPRREVKYSRQNVFSRDHFRCVYCGNRFKRDQLTLDHIIPRSQGGKSTWDNTVSSCFKCNQRKADRTLKDAGMSLLIQPTKPKWISPLQNVNIETHPCKSWEHFIPGELSERNQTTNEGYFS